MQDKQQTSVTKRPQSESSQSTQEDSLFEMSKENHQKMVEQMREEFLQEKNSTKQAE